MNPHVARSAPALARANGIELCYDTFGDAQAPPLVLIMGLAAQMIAWDDEFCAALASRGYWVIRFDNRDIGLSTRLEGLGVPNVPQLLQAHLMGQPVRAAYTLSDMARDVVGLLDELARTVDKHDLGVRVERQRPVKVVPVARSAADCQQDRHSSTCGIASIWTVDGLAPTCNARTWVLNTSSAE